MSELPNLHVCTLASHSALQILKGAHDEGFETIGICERKNAKVYRSFKVADDLILVDSFSKLVGLDKELVKKNAVLIPHGSLLNSLSITQIKKLKTHYYGNKNVLEWESSRDLQRKWLAKAGLTLPRIYRLPEDIDGPVITKFDGAGGGKGYFLAHTPTEFKQKMIALPNDKAHVIQEYIVGAPVYIHYFYSSLTNELEIMGFDKRYESNADSVGRIAAKDQIDLNIETSYNITGNLPLVVRESLLGQIFDMGLKVIKASKLIDGRGLFGPFCLETVITPDLEFYVFEISARIVAGTNPYINGSPYTDLRYNEPMSTGRRIAREIKIAAEKNRLEDIFSE
jgi:5-formaminoimidazole-4-carboxamide-1-(beta)-D-ribofuranosyl 5'-monophosphate synthetase